MPIEFRCKQCQTLLRTPDDTVGRRTVCPQCGTEMEIPYHSSPGPRRRVAPVEDHGPTRPAMDTTSPAEQMAIGSLVFGIMSLCFSCCCLISLPTAIAGIALGVKGLESRHRALAITGIVLSGVGLLMTVGFNLANMFFPNSHMQWQHHFP